ncbi:hypothetical protein [Bacillus sp. V59.32b]|uniref:hypothetical protein n=1 Tax=Bacillus sp. V59.32b TaxID=1758642 RepID=UPI000E3CD25F|nr:hypothetical protein [Bacillus sp. V59.32b]RFU68286.1 hypothetical protein D0463_05915 [Bacillus sp. V59.32b]
MKVKSTFRKNHFIFDFFVDSVISIENEETPAKLATVTTVIQTFDKQLLWSGRIRVKVNEFGIYPLPEDVNSISGPLSMKKMMLVELRRYIKPQKPFL